MRILPILLQGLILLFVIDSIAQTNQFVVDLNATAENDEAIRGISTNPLLVRTVGVHGKSDATDGQGVWGEGRTGVYAEGGDFGLFAVGSFRAGFFSGDIEYTGNIIGPMSDIRLKRILKSESSYLDLLNKMTIRKFLYKTEKYPSLNLTSRIQYGVIAQELEKVFPNLVVDSNHPAQYSEQGKITSEKLEFKSVNYLGLIPITVASVQELSCKLNEQQELIIELNKKIDILTRAVGLLK